MDVKTKINTVVSIVLVSLIALLAYWVQLPTEDLKAQVINDETVSTDTSLIRIQDFAFDPDIMRVAANTTVSWLHDEPESNADVQHTITSYDPDDSAVTGDLFESDLMSLGDTFSYTFEEPGVYYYNCSLYPFMTGKICVGDESEELDEDCMIEVSGSTEEEIEITTEEDEEPEVVEEDIDNTEEEDDTALLSETDENLESEEPILDSPPQPAELEDDIEADDSSDTLYPAADSNYEDDNNEAVFQGPEEEQSYETPEAQLAESGPEEMLYLFLLLVSFWTASKITSKSHV